MVRDVLGELLGQYLMPRRKRTPPPAYVDWTAHMADGGDNEVLDNKAHARKVAATGWVINGRVVAFISRDHDNGSVTEYEHGSTI